VTSEQEQGTIDEDKREDRDKRWRGKAGYHKTYREGLLNGRAAAQAGRCGPSIYKLDIVVPIMVATHASHSF